MKYCQICAFASKNYELPYNLQVKNRKGYLKHCCHIPAVNVWFSAVIYEFMLSVCLIFFAVLIKIKSLSTKSSLFSQAQSCVVTDFFLSKYISMKLNISLVSLSSLPLPFCRYAWFLSTVTGLYISTNSSRLSWTTVTEMPHSLINFNQLFSSDCKIYLLHQTPFTLCN